MIDFATESELVLSLTRDQGNAPFVVTLTQHENRWHADGYGETDVTVIDQHVFHVPLPAVFDLANDWLLAQHRSAVLPTSWALDVSDCDSLLAFKSRVFPAARAAEDAHIAAAARQVA
ncbi:MULTISPECIES: hypothetical protein [Mycobacterium avium complex (MAC)]|uniref:hypothetical protein n=1 Tax=Mycobacterium avium complex (MAC) TaxID=120793 RepID=UPI000B34CD47|nr:MULTISPECIES: hypothetical protein [Mycobacterium avium complex (MAC)]UCN12787.1 hypothetical protein LFT50_28090 [Mycobacterium intracellulare subsp. chimaera]